MRELRLQCNRTAPLVVVGVIRVASTWLLSAGRVCPSRCLVPSLVMLAPSSSLAPRRPGNHPHLLGAPLSCQNRSSGPSSTRAMSLSNTSVPPMNSCSVSSTVAAHIQVLADDLAHLGKRIAEDEATDGLDDGLKTLCAKKSCIFNVSWRRRRDSNPRYALTAYNGLANRRLQPLGHVSVLDILP